MTNTATEKQILFINTLKGQRDLTDPMAQAAISVGQELWRMGQFSKQAASLLIDALKAAPRAQSADAPVAPAGPAPEGMHMVDGRVFKVQVAVHGSGQRYAKELHVEEDGSAHFEYAPGWVKNLTEDTKMTLEQAKEFGALYGTCCVCGRTLTNEESIEAGIGPVCAGRF